MRSLSGATFLLASSLLAACGGSPSRLADNVSYQQLADGFDTIEQCHTATAGATFNCYHLLELCSNGGYILVVTDIANEGRYTLAGQTVNAVQSGGVDGPPSFTATLRDDGTLTSPQLSGMNPWQLDTNADPTELARECDSWAGRQ
jgi:hypothetical protein